MGVRQFDLNVAIGKYVLNDILQARNYLPPEGFYILTSKCIYGEMAW
jgi:hypothetical protein